MLETELPMVREEVVKNSIANFHLTEEYQGFDSYQRRLGYAEVVDTLEGLFLDLNTAELGIKYLDEVPQTPTKEAAEEETLIEEPSNEVAVGAFTADALKPHPLSSQCVT